MTQRARRRHRRGRRHKVSKVLLGLTVVGAVAGIGALSFGIWVLSVAVEAPPIDELQPIDRGETSVVLAADGSRLGYVESDTIREEIPLREIPQDLRDATVAIEDERFYQHGGVDPSAILRAALRNLEAGRTVEGGSTITQQLVRNLYIAEPEDTLERKIREATLAEELEEEHTKEWILREYLNTASYGTVSGKTAVGVEAAAQTFFSKPARELTLTESALLAGLPQAPSEYNPLSNPNDAVARRNNVLDAMADQGYITEYEAPEARQQDLGLQPSDRYSEVREPFFFDYVEQELIDRYGVATVRQGGLTVHTSIDPTLQEAAKQAIAAQIATLGGPSGALVSIDPLSGRIVAMASSGDYDTLQYNLAAQGQRQPGSAFKPYVLTTALLQGIDPDATYYSGSAPKTLKLPDGITTWEVNNAEGGNYGTMSLSSATTNSVNVVYAQLTLDVGAENVAETAHKLGITSPLDGLPAEGIGGLRVGVSPLEMASAYSTFAAGGVHHRPAAITSVEFPDGEQDVLTQEEGKRVISDGIAYEVTRILKTVITSGTGTAAGYGCPAAGKTGTTDQQTDAWFAGYTPRLSTAVWVGYPEGRISMGSAAFGGSYAAPIWHDYMLTAASEFCGDFPAAQNLPDLSPFYSDHAVTGKSEEDYTTGDEGSYDYDSGEPAPEDGSEDGGGDSGDYDPDLYAPGAGQEPAPVPPGGGGGGAGGGGTGGGGGSTGPPGGGGPPPGSPGGVEPVPGGVSPGA